MFNFGNLMPNAPPFNSTYRCFSAAILGDRTDIERGGKIILPPSSLDWLTRLNTQYPMMFKVTNPNPQTTRVTHCGVLEFIAEEGQCYLPHWMMRNLLLNEGDKIKVESASLAKAKYVKFQAQSTDFLEITDPRAVLEFHLRNFACLTIGDVIAFEYGTKVYELLVKEVKPGNAICLIEADVNTEFEAPVGYEEPKRVQDAAARDEAGSVPPEPHRHLEVPLGDEWVPFVGTGNRLDGRARKDSQKIGQPATKLVARGVPNYDYKPGTLHFLRVLRPKPESELRNEPVPVIDPFAGKGKKLRDRK